MKPLTEKILKSGLVDKHMAQMLEKWGNLPEGASELIPDSNPFKDATKEQLIKFGEEIGDEVEKARILKESQLDLDRLRWPTKVSLYNEKEELILSQQPALIDRMNRLYFRMEDIKEEWFVPGYRLRRDRNDLDHPGCVKPVDSRIMESTVLYADDQPVCLQVSSQKIETYNPYAEAEPTAS
jgi:hypothetical protein